jgi:hypothetical protein
MTFNNQNLQELYNIAYSSTFASLQRINDIYTTLIVQLKIVLLDDEAIQESKKWSEFHSIIHEHNFNTQKKIFNHLSFDVSMCFGLYMCIYH